MQVHGSTSQIQHVVMTEKTGVRTIQPNTADPTAASTASWTPTAVRLLPSVRLTLIIILGNVLNAVNGLKVVLLLTVTMELRVFLSAVLTDQLPLVGRKITAEITTKPL